MHRRIIKLLDGMEILKRYGLIVFFCLSGCMNDATETRTFSILPLEVDGQGYAGTSFEQKILSTGEVRAGPLILMDSSVVLRETSEMSPIILSKDRKGSYLKIYERKFYFSEFTSGRTFLFLHDGAFQRYELDTKYDISDLKDEERLMEIVMEALSKTKI